MNEDKKILFEAMHKVTGMPLNENIHNHAMMGGILNTNNMASKPDTTNTSNPDPYSIGMDAWKDILNNNTISLNSPEEINTFVKGIIQGLQGEAMQYAADRFATNAGAAPDEMV